MLEEVNMLFEACQNHEHGKCVSESQGTRFHKRCVCICHLVIAVADYLHGDESREGLERTLQRYDTFS